MRGAGQSRLLLLLLLHQCDGEPDGYGDCQSRNVAAGVRAELLGCRQ